jgi:hypothetical protein
MELEQHRRQVSLAKVREYHLKICNVTVPTIIQCFETRILARNTRKFYCTLITTIIVPTFSGLLVTLMAAAAAAPEEISAYTTNINLQHS